METRNSSDENSGCIVILLIILVIALIFAVTKPKEIDVMEARKSKPDVTTTYKLHMLGGHTKYHTIKHKEGDCIDPVLNSCYGNVYIEFKLCDNGEELDWVLNVVNYEKVK